MSTPACFEEFPEVMTEEEYPALPEDVARMIEIVHGHIIRCESPVPMHNRIARRPAGGLEAARSPEGPCLSVETDNDVVLWRVPKFTFRLDAATREYRLHAVHRSVLELGASRAGHAAVRGLDLRLSGGGQGPTARRGQPAAASLARARRARSTPSRPSSSRRRSAGSGFAEAM